MWLAAATQFYERPQSRRLSQVLHIDVVLASVIKWPNFSIGMHKAGPFGLTILSARCKPKQESPQNAFTRNVSAAYVCRLIAAALSLFRNLIHVCRRLPG